MITEDNFDISVHFRQGGYDPDRGSVVADLRLTCGFYANPDDSVRGLAGQAKKAVLRKIYGDIEARVWRARHVAMMVAAPGYDHHALDKAFEAILTPEE